MTPFSVVEFKGAIVNRRPSLARAVSEDYTLLEFVWHSSFHFVLVSEKKIISFCLVKIKLNGTDAIISFVQFEISSSKIMFGCHKDLWNEMISRRTTGLGTEIDSRHRINSLKFAIEITVPISWQPNTRWVWTRLNFTVLVQWWQPNELLSLCFSCVILLYHHFLCALGLLHWLYWKIASSGSAIHRPYCVQRLNISDWAVHAIFLL